jgi:hypothetical protein
MSRCPRGALPPWRLVKVYFQLVQRILKTIVFKNFRNIIFKNSDVAFVVIGRVLPP